MLKLYRDINNLSTIKGNWDNLYNASDIATPYQRYDFVVLTWSTWCMPGDKLYIVCHHKKEEWPADAIFPCYIRKGVLRLIDFHSDFCEPLECVPLNERYELYLEFFNYIAKDAHIKRLHFHNIKSESPMVGYFLAFSRFPDISSRTGYSVIEMSDDRSNDWIGNIQTLARQKQRKIKDIVKKFTDVRLVTFDNSTNAYPSEDIDVVADAMIDADIRSNEYLSDTFKSYLKTLYESNIVRVAIIYERNIPKAVFFLLFDSHSDEWIEWILLYTDKRYNIVLMCEWLKYMYESQPPSLRLNLACGLYEYKLHNFHPNIHIVLDLVDYISVDEKRKATVHQITAGFTNKIKKIFAIR